jgi:hypothetical protein
MAELFERLRAALETRYRMQRELGESRVRGLMNPRSAPSASAANPKGIFRAQRLSRRLGASRAAEPAFQRRNHEGRGA